MVPMMNFNEIGLTLLALGLHILGTAKIMVLAVSSI